MSKAKEILVHSPNGLFCHEQENSVYGLTNLKYATRFANRRNVNAAIKYCQAHCCVGNYRYEVL